MAMWVVAAFWDQLPPSFLSASFSTNFSAMSPFSLENRSVVIVWASSLAIFCCSSLRRSSGMWCSWCFVCARGFIKNIVLAS